MIAEKFEPETPGGYRGSAQRPACSVVRTPSGGFVPARSRARRLAVESSSRRSYNRWVTCDLCKDDDGTGAHFHAFIEGKHYWICEPCKKRLRIDSEHTDE
jgi:hypothetical protein